jgi:hypothetical protein
VTVRFWCAGLRNVSSRGVRCGASAACLGLSVPLQTMRATSFPSERSARVTEPSRPYLETMWWIPMAFRTGRRPVYPRRFAYQCFPARSITGNTLSRSPPPTRVDGAQTLPQQPLLPWGGVQSGGDDSLPWCGSRTRSDFRARRSMSPWIFCPPGNIAPSAKSATCPRSLVCPAREKERDGPADLACLPAFPLVGLRPPTRVDGAQTIFSDQVFRRRLGSFRCWCAAGS